MLTVYQAQHERRHEVVKVFGTLRSHVVTWWVGWVWVEGDRATRGCWSQTGDILLEVLRSVNFSSVSNEATTRRFSWTSIALVFYVRSATWAIVWEMSEGKGLETGGGKGVSYRWDEDLVKVVRVGKREKPGNLGRRVYRTGWPLACGFWGNRSRGRLFSGFGLEGLQRWGCDGQQSTEKRRGYTVAAGRLLSWAQDWTCIGDTCRMSRCRATVREEVCHGNTDCDGPWLWPVTRVMGVDETE